MFIQGEGNSQGVNPYSCILNNPLAGTDPSGYIVCDATSRQVGCKGNSINSVLHEVKIRWPFGGDAATDNGDNDKSSVPIDIDFSSPELVGDPKEVAGQLPEGNTLDYLNDIATGVAVNTVNLVELAASHYNPIQSTTALHTGKLLLRCLRLRLVVKNLDKMLVRLFHWVYLDHFCKISDESNTVSCCKGNKDSISLHG